MKLETIVYKFYQGLEEGKLYGRRCLECGAIEFPPKPACNSCGYRETEWVELSGEAELVSFVLSGMMNDRPHLAEHGTFVFGAVRMAEGPELNAVVYGIDKKDVEDARSRLPLPVKPKIVQRNGFKTLYFELA